MGRIALAFKLFFQILSNRQIAERAANLALPAPPPEEAKPKPAPAPPKPKEKPAPPAGLDALILLATLQREARFLDLFQEDLSEYEDAQIGAAVRDVQRDTKATLNRLFAIQPVRAEEEGGQIEVGSSDPPHEIRWVGKVENQKPSSGTLVHRGWKATRCDVPKFQGTIEQAQVLHPAEVEV